jgi:hypothetical protein
MSTAASTRRNVAPDGDAPHVQCLRGGRRPRAIATHDAAPAITACGSADSGP